MHSKQSFIKDIFKLSTVPVIAQIMGLLLTPIITRIYSPDSFGEYTSFVSIIALVSVFSTLGYHSALILPKSDAEAKNIFILTVLNVLLVTFSITLITYFFGIKIINVFGLTLLQDKLFLIPFFVFLHGVTQVLRFWNTRKKEFGNIAISRVVFTTANKGFNIFSGYISGNLGINLIFGTVFARFLSIIPLMKKISLREFQKDVKIFEILKVFKKYIKFPKYSIWSELLSRIPEVLIVYFITQNFSTNLLGQYSISILIISLPNIIFINSIMESFSPRIAMAKHENNHLNLLLQGL